MHSAVQRSIYRDYFLYSRRMGQVKTPQGRLYQVKLHSKNETTVLGISIDYLESDTITGILCMLVIFQDRPMVSYII